MHRTRTSIPYEILHGIQYSSNISSIFAFLSYFPPPPPMVPSPPPRRSWTCSSRTLSSSSCFVADDLNPPGLRTYVPLISTNQTLLFPNTSHISKVANPESKPPSIIDFFQNRLTIILILILFLIILSFLILLFFLFLYIRRLRQRQLASNTHTGTTNNNDTNTNDLELNNNSDKKTLYHRLVPYRSKHRKRPTTATTISRNSNDQNNSSRLTNHHSSALELGNLSTTSVIHRNANQEQEQEHVL